MSRLSSKLAGILLLSFILSGFIQNVKTEGNDDQPPGQGSGDDGKPEADNVPPALQQLAADSPNLNLGDEGLLPASSPLPLFSASVNATCQLSASSNIFIANLSPAFVRSDSAEASTDYGVAVNSDAKITKLAKKKKTGAVEPPKVTCLSTYFVGNSPLVTRLGMSADLTDESVVIMLEQVNDISAELISDLIGPKRLTIGTLVNKSMPAELAKRIVDAGGSVLYNLELSNQARGGFINNTEPFDGHLFIYSPFDKSQSFGSSVGIDSADVQLAQFVVTRGGDLCKSTVRAIKLHNEWERNIPTLYGRPEMNVNSGRFNFLENYGTHLDYGNGTTPSELCLSISKCVRIRSNNASGSNDVVPLDDVVDWERIHGSKLPAMVFVDTGFGANWDRPTKFTSEYPGVSEQAIKYLTGKGVKVIGTDSAKLDKYADVSKYSSPAMAAVRDAGAFGLPMMKASGLKDLSTTTPATCLLLYFRLVEGAGSPAAVIAFQELDKFPSRTTTSTTTTTTTATTTSTIRTPPEQSTVSASVAQSQAQLSADSTQSKMYIANFSPNITSANGATIDYHSQTISADVIQSHLTTFWTKKPVNFSTKACIPINFFNDMQTLRKMDDSDALVIFETKINKTDIQNLTAKRFIIGTLVGNSIEVEDIRVIVESGGHVLSNLKLPENFTATGKLFGNLLVFSPLDQKTSTNQMALNNISVNLAQLTVINDADKFCDKATISLHTEWTAKTPYFAPLATPPEIVGDRFKFSGHYGTHLDSGTHFTEAGQLAMNQHPDSSSFGSCVKISYNLALNRNNSVPLDVFTNWESKYGPKFPQMVFVQTGFQKSSWSNSTVYNTEYPGISSEAINFLIERGVKVIGIDSASLDRSADGMTLSSHLATTKNDTIALVNLNTTGLEQLSESTPAKCLLLYFRIDQGTASPAAIIASQISTKLQSNNDDYSLDRIVAVLALTGVCVFCAAVLSLIIFFSYHRYHQVTPYYHKA